MKFFNLGLVAVISVCLFGCAKTFEEQSYTSENQSFHDLLMEEINDSNDFNSRLQLGRLLFEHNKIDKADEILSKLVEEDSDNMEALAWHGANRCKMAGRMTPWLMGIRKLGKVNECLDMVKAALDNSDDFTVKLIAINTGSVVAVSDSLDWATSTRENLEKEINSAPSSFPQSALNYFYMAAAENDIANENLAKATQYLEKIIAASSSDYLTMIAKTRLAEIRQS